MDLQPYKTFTETQQQKIQALNATIVTYTHEGTGARHVHLANESEEKVFMVALCTVPTDSTGVAHILEHTSLCGSERYPVRDPFFMMTRRSLNTFMNAFTSSDWTAYPFATKNEKDFENLLSVYLDAVFFARLDELDFSQEGHRLNFTKPDDLKSELCYQGVVYNEMKGAMSSPVSILWQHLTTQMFPTTTYHYNSGGEPKDIPTLSYQQLKTFYQQFYHPTNAVFMTFGNMDVAPLQQQIEQAVLKRFKHEPQYLRKISNEKAFDKPKQAIHTYPASSKKSQTHVIKAWLLGESHNVFDQLEASLLGQALLDNSSSPLYAALEKTKHAKAPSPLCGLSDDCKQMMLVAGVQGSDAEHVDAIETLIMKTLKQVAQDGIPYEQLEAALHQIELNRREITGGRYPYGLELLLAVMPAVVHGDDPVALLDIDKPLKKMAALIKKPKYIKDLVQKRLIDNQHCVRLVLEPDVHFNKKAKETLAKELKIKKEAMSQQQLKAIASLNKTLVKRQQQEDDPNILPQVTVADVSEDFPYAQGSLGHSGLPLAFFPQGTNGLVYQDVIHQLPTLNEKQLKHLPYLMMMIGELGTQNKSYEEMQAWQSQVSGGVWGGLHINTLPDDCQSTYALLYFGGKALTSKYSEFTKFLKASIYDMRFTELEHIHQIVSQARKHAEQSMVGNGHALAMLAASSVHAPMAMWSHQASGLGAVKEIQSLDSELTKDITLQNFAADLKKTYAELISTPHELLLVSQEEGINAQLKVLKKNWPFATKPMTENVVTSIKVPSMESCMQQMWLINADVNYCAKAYKGVNYDHKDTPLLKVLAHVLRNGYLHRAVREQGGAYGGGAQYQADYGVMRFYSYRDPRLLETLDDFDASIEWVIKGDWQERLVQEAILEAVSQFDKPASPANEAKNTFYNECFDRDYKVLNDYRNGLIHANKDELIRVAQTYLIPEKASIAVIANPQSHKHYGDSGMTVTSLLVDQ
jgi:presequence protease